MTHIMTYPMTHVETYIELNVKQVIEAYGFSRSTFERWRDAVYSGVGDPPYSKDDLKIILEYAKKQSVRAFGASKNKNNRKITQILRTL